MFILLERLIIFVDDSFDWHTNSINLSFLSTTEPTEHIEQIFELESKFGTPNLAKFEELVNTEMMWVITEIVSEPNVGRRVKIIKQFIKVSLIFLNISN